MFVVLFTVPGMHAGSNTGGAELQLHPGEQLLFENCQEQSPLGHRHIHSQVPHEAVVVVVDEVVVLLPAVVVVVLDVVVVDPHGSGEQVVSCPW